MILDHLQRAQLLRFIISKDTLDEALIVADAMLYYQTSRAPQFVLAGIPTFQIGHEVYEDIVVRNHLCSVITDKDSLVQAFEEWKNPQEIARDGQAVRDGLGMRADWAERLERLVEEAQKKR